MVTPNTTLVVKLGGRALETPGASFSLAAEIMFSHRTSWPLASNSFTRAFEEVREQMAELGFMGLPYPEKPPLVFWMQAGVESLVGTRTAVGARLPSLARWPPPVSAARAPPSTT